VRLFCDNKINLICKLKNWLVTLLRIRIENHTYSIKIIIAFTKSKDIVFVFIIKMKNKFNF